MGALNSFSTDIINTYQDLGDLNFLPGQTPDPLEISGHHIELGSDLQRLLERYQISSISGVQNWFVQMAGELASPEGISVPFAETLQNVTGMPAHEAFEWLSVNIADTLIIGTEATIVAFFKKNPKIYSTCLVLGIAFGLYSDNPLMIAINGLQYFCKLRQDGRLKFVLWNSADRFVKISVSTVGRVCTATFMANMVMELLGVNLPDLAGHLLDNLHFGKHVAGAAQLAAEAASAADFIEGVSNFGLSLLVGQAVGKVVSWMNDDLKKELAEITPKYEYRQRLIELIKKEAPPETLVPVIELMEENGIYEPMLHAKSVKSEV